MRGTPRIWSKNEQLWLAWNNQLIFNYTQPVYMLLTIPCPEIVEKAKVIHGASKFYYLSI
jgi:hypothetical protein